MDAVVGALMLARARERQAQGDRAAHRCPARACRGSRPARSRTSSASTSREWDGIIADFERSVGSRHGDEPHARHGPERGGRRRRPTVEAPFGQALARLGAAAARDRRADRRPRQVHRHPCRSATPSRTASSTSAWPSRTSSRSRPGWRAPGKTPFATTYGVFASRRAYDFVAIALAHSGLDVKIVAGLPGLTTGYGGTHQAIEDLALMRMIPGLVVIDPCDATEIAAATEAIADHQRAGLHAAPARRGAGRARPRLPLRDRQGAAAARGQRRRHHLDRADDRAGARRGGRARPSRASPPACCMCRRSSRSTPRPWPSSRRRSAASSPPRTMSWSAGSPASSSRRCSRPASQRKVTRIGLPDRYIECGVGADLCRRATG